MADKSLIERWVQMMKITPSDSRDGKKSWHENSPNLLSTEKKIFAIKISESERSACYQSFISPKKESKRLVLKKWIGKCKWKLPKAIILISVLQIFFHLLGPMNLAYQTLAFSPLRKIELWRYFTYALLHVSTAHLLINLILQFVVAFPLESEVDSRNVILVYIGGILSGSLAASLSQNFTLMVGASSGVYSLLTSHISHVYMNFTEISYRTHRITFIVALLVSDIIYATIHCLGNYEPQIAIGSHIAGAIGGVLLGFVFYEDHRLENRDEEGKFKLLKRISVTVYLCFVSIVIVTNAIFNLS